MTGFVQVKTADLTSPGTSTMTITTPFTGNITAGSTILAFVRMGGSTATISNWSDATNGSWTSLPNNSALNDGSNLAYVFYFPNSAGGVNPTITISMASQVVTVRVVFLEVSTNFSSGVIDQSPSPTAVTVATATFTCNTVTTTNANDYLISWFEADTRNFSGVTDNVAGSVPASGWTNRAAFPAGGFGLCVSDNTVVATGTYHEVFTGTGGTDTGFAGTIAIKLSAAGVTQLQPILVRDDNAMLWYRQELGY